MIFGFEGYSGLNPWIAAAILAKTLGYAMALLAAGGAVFLALFGRDYPLDTRGLRRLTAGIAILGLGVLAARVGIRAARISGMGFDGLVDPAMVSIVWDSPLGDAGTLRAAGLVLVCAVLLRGPAGRALSVAGAAAVAMSFTFVGHSLEQPRWLFGAFLTLHLLAAAYWVGALWPLHRAADRSGRGVPVLHRFGVLAGWIVGGLVVVGVAMALMLAGSVSALLGTAYGWVLLTKVLLVAALLGLAAANKLRLVPRLAAAEPGAAAALRRSIALEMAVVALILLATATLTMVTTPPTRL